MKTEMAGIERLRGSLTFMCIPMAPTISVASPAEAGLFGKLRDAFKTR